MSNNEIITDENFPDYGNLKYSMDSAEPQKIFSWIFVSYKYFMNELSSLHKVMWLYK